MPDGAGEVDGVGVTAVVGDDCAGAGVVTDARFADPALDAEFADEESAAGVDVVAGTVVVLLETVLVIGPAPPPQLTRATMETARKSDMHLDG